MFKKILFIMFVLSSILYLIFRNKIYNDKVLLFGSSLPKTGIMKAWGNSVNHGTNAYFKYVNENNILTKNKKIKLVDYDDKYEPELTYDNIKKLIYKDKIFALYGFVGTPTVKYIFPLLENTNIPFIAAFTGADFLRNTSKPNIVNFRSSYKEELYKIVSYLKNKKNISKFAIFYQNDDYGKEGYVSLVKTLNKQSLKLIAQGTYKRNTLSITHAFAEIKNAKPEAIILVGAYKANALFIKKAKQNKNLKNAIFSILSFGDANEMVKELNYNTSNVLFSQVVPSYNNNKIKVVEEYQRLMSKYYPNESLGFISLESFLVAKTIVNALNNIDGNITRENFLEKIKTLSSTQLNGIHTTYKNTQLLNKVYLFEYKNNDFKEIY